MVKLVKMIHVSQAVVMAAMKNQICLDPDNNSTLVSVIMIQSFRP